MCFAFLFFLPIVWLVGSSLLPCCCFCQHFGFVYRKFPDEVSYGQAGALGNYGWSPHLSMTRRCCNVCAAGPAMTDWGGSGAGYLPAGREFQPISGSARRVECAEHGVVGVEQIPWSAGKRPYPGHDGGLSSRGATLSWRETAPVV